MGAGDTRCKRCELRTAPIRDQNPNESASLTKDEPRQIAANNIAKPPELLWTRNAEQVIY